MKGKLALCGKGTLGLITHAEPQPVSYGDGSKGKAFVGIHLTDKIAPIGSPWSSRNPNVVGELGEVTTGYFVRGATYGVADLRPDIAKTTAEQTC